MKFVFPVYKNQKYMYIQPSKKISNIYKKHNVHDITRGNHGNIETQRVPNKHQKGIAIITLKSEVQHTYIARLLIQQLRPQSLRTDRAKVTIKSN